MKQVLREQPEFDEKRLYIRMDSLMQGKVGAADIRDFLVSRGSDCDLDQALSFMQVYDRDGDAALSVEEFIRAVTPTTMPLEPDALAEHAKNILNEAKYASRSV
jgi:Ca2+-binding EF-hand superfamily protein